MSGANRYAGVRVGPPETRREPVHGGSRLGRPASLYLVHPCTRKPTSLLATVSGGPTHTPAQSCGAHGFLWGLIEGISFADRDCRDIAPG